jgi:hypothetical protein
MTPPEIATIITALGGLGGLGALVTSLATLAKTRQVRADTSQLRPNHGSSVADKIDGLVREVHGLGHQVGELRESMVQEQEDRRQGDETLRHLIESRPIGYPWDK